MSNPARRDVLAASGGLLAGLAGGYLVRPRRRGETTPDPTPLAWADTEWPYPDYDPARTRNPPAASAPDDGLTEDWRRETERAFERAPLVASNGNVYTARTDGRVAVLGARDPANGERHWERRHRDDESLGAPRVLAPGDGAYYRFGEFAGAPLGLLAAASGEHVWGVDRPPHGGWTVGGGRLYYGDRGTGALRAYDARTGDHLWTTGVDDDRLVVESFHAEYGVFAGSFGRLYALDPADGSVRWDVAVPKHAKSGPVVAGGRAVVSKWMDGMDVVAFNAATGDEQWRYPLATTRVETSDGMALRWYEVDAATAETVLVREEHADPSPARLHAVDAATGDRRWRIEPPGDASAFAAPTLVDSSVYVCVRRGDAALLRIDLRDGAVLDSWPLPGPAFGPVVTDGRVLVQAGETLLAFS